MMLVLSDAPDLPCENGDRPMVRTFGSNDRIQGGSTEILASIQRRRPSEVMASIVVEWAEMHADEACRRAVGS